MGRRRKRTIRIPKKTLPKVFLCPRCGAEAVNILFDKSKQIAKVDCGECGLKDEIKYSRVMGLVDVYCKFIDNFQASISNPATR
jgi:transcription elongation factor Elf1